MSSFGWYLFGLERPRWSLFFFLVVCLPLGLIYIPYFLMSLLCQEMVAQQLLDEDWAETAGV
jgi:hypothetical protein